MRGEDTVFPVHNEEQRMETYRTLKAVKHNFEYYVRSLVPFHNKFDLRTKFFTLILLYLSATAIASF